MSEARKLRSVTRADAKYQTRIGDVLAELCRLYEAGRLDGIYAITNETDEKGEFSLNYRRAAMRSADVSWAAVAILLAEHARSP